MNPSLLLVPIAFYIDYSNKFLFKENVNEFSYNTPKQNDQNSAKNKNEKRQKKILDGKIQIQIRTLH